ncbi:MAG: exopolyphosphatase [Desulfobacteraceae bacterium]|nr:exopolyphosphatase [Desulfobacteraceae bacterium]
MRIVTRPDFDGIVCAVFLFEAEDITNGIKWVEPDQIQKNSVDIRTGDIMANLPYDSRCSLWFDHHVSNTPETEIDGSFAIAPSAAGVIYHYYKKTGRLTKDYDELVKNTDIIDAADLNQDQVLHPENYPYILLSMTIQNKNFEDIDYWNRLIELLKQKSIKEIHQDPEVKKRCDNVIKENQAFEAYLKKYTRIEHQVSITDFRPISKDPSGNRFLTYSLFPQAMASVKIRYKDQGKDYVSVSIGHSIFNKNCRVNVGKLLSGFGGGGHKGAGGCTLETDKADQCINEILNTLFENREE